MKIIVTPHSVPPKYHRSIDEGKQQNKDIACSLVPRPSSILLHSSRSKGRFPIDFTAWSLCRPSLGRRRKGSLVRSCKNWREKNRPYYLQMTWRCLVFLSSPFEKKHMHPKGIRPIHWTRTWTMPPDSSDDESTGPSKTARMMVANNGRVGQCDTHYIIIIKSLPKAKAIGIIKLTLYLSFVSLQGERWTLLSVPLDNAFWSVSSCYSYSETSLESIVGPLECRVLGDMWFIRRFAQLGVGRRFCSSLDLTRFTQYWTN